MMPPATAADIALMTYGAMIGATIAWAFFVAFHSFEEED